MVFACSLFSGKTVHFSLAIYNSAPIIQRIISDLDEKIVNCDIQHEKEGMIDIRAAYARCLNIINKHKEARYERVNQQ